MRRGRMHRGRRQGRPCFRRLFLGAVMVSMVVGTITATPQPAAAQVPEGRVLSWGTSFWGELGDGTIGERHLPDEATMPVGVTVTGIASGYSHHLALTDEGEVYAWGYNDFGQVGDGTTTDRDSPVLVQLPVGVTVTDITSGWLHSFALASTGEVYGWGYNDFGQVGDGTTIERHTPVEVDIPEGPTVTALAAGAQHSLALTSDGEVLGWGDNFYGSVGDGTTVERHAPVEVDLPVGVTVTDVAAGELHSVAVTSSGEVLGWGSNGDGELGQILGDPYATAPVDVPIPVGVTVTSVATHDQTSFAVTSTGDAVAWGVNDFGQYGNGSNEGDEFFLPLAVVLPEGTTVTDVAGGHTAGIALTGPPSA